MARKTTPGVLYVHSRDCADHDRCARTCNPSPTPWQGWIFDSKYVDPATGKRGKKIRKRFATYAAAKGWRADADHAVRNQKLRAADTASARKTLREEVAEWLEGAKAGQILNKREETYKPSVLRNYELSLRRRVLPVLGDHRFADVTLADLLELKEKLQGDGHAGSTVRNSFVPLAAIYRRARLQQRVTVDPTTDLPLPTSGTRNRAATPTDAETLLEALPQPEVWAGAFYSGLRLGELRALRVRNVDLEAGTISVEHSWDIKEGEILPKTRASARKVFLSDHLCSYLDPLVEDRAEDAFVFGSDLSPFDPRAVARKAERALDKLDKTRADDELPPLPRYTLHEARHSFSTWMDHSGVSPDRANRYMGHSSSDAPSRYRHLLPTQLTEDQKLFDAYLSGSASGKVIAISAA